MMDISFISSHNSSRRIFDKNNSLLSQGYEVATTFTEYSSLAEFNFLSNLSTIYNNFKEITKLCNEASEYLSMAQYFGTSLNEYLEIIKRNLNMLNKQDDFELSNSAFIVLNEIKTWKLINLIYEDRFKSQSNKTAEFNFNQNETFSEVEIMKKLFLTNKNLREAQIVLDWLEFFYEEKLNETNIDFLIGSHGKSWEHTKYFISKRSMFSRNKQNELDPDAPLRGNLKLADNDKENEDEYLRYLFHCVQSGNIEKAKLICQSHDEFWRSQTLLGWIPFQNPLICHGVKDVNSIDVIGNPNRNLFKQACRQLSENNDLNLYERAIYATFCGNLRVLSMVEKDWNGLLWAHFKVYIESVVDNYLKTFTDNGVFNTQALFGDDDFDVSRFAVLRDIEDRMISSETDDDITNSWQLDQIFDEISLKSNHDPIAVLHRTNQSNKTSKLYFQSIFEIVQQFIILGDIEGLIQQVAYITSRLPETKNAADKNIIRFLAHLIIFIYSTHENLKIEVYHDVLEEYIKCLIEDKCLDNVAFYISKLSTDLQIKWYCKCLMGVTNFKERRKCIQDGLEYDLPIIEITQHLVQTIRISENEFETISPITTDTNFDDRDKFDMFVTDLDKTKIDCLDWLTFLPDQQCHLIREGNAFCRTYLEKDKLQAAKMVMNKISDEVWSQLNINVNKGNDWLKSSLYENECLRKYIESHDLFGDWYNHFTCQKPAELNLDINSDLNKLSFQEKQMLQKKHDEYSLALQQWNTLNNFHANRAFECFLNLLKMGSNGWLSDSFNDDIIYHEMNESDPDNDKPYTRNKQIKKLRKKCIVTIVFMAIKILTNSNENEKCFAFINLLADENYQLYSLFETKQLQRLLGKVRQCSLALMSEGKDALGIRVVSL